MTRSLGRREPTDFCHIDKYPLQALAAEQRPVAVPSAIGVNWYASFDYPIKYPDGRYRVLLPKETRLRGGHCVCVAPYGFQDSRSWHRYYNQGAEGACVGFGCCRMMSLLNRRRYDARWLYREAQRVDEWEGENYSGTSVRAGLDVLRVAGALRTWGSRIFSPDKADGIAANRWATSMQDWLDALDRPNATEIPFLNSWGASYPKVVWMAVEVAERLMNEDGEFSIVTDV